MRVFLRIGIMIAALQFGCTEAQAVGVCPDAGVFSSSIVSEFCFPCLFPIRIAGVPTGSGPMPPNVTEQSLCSCSFFDVGVTVGSWHPTRLIEVVTTPYCSPSLGGVEIATSAGVLSRT